MKCIGFKKERKKKYYIFSFLFNQREKTFNIIKSIPVIGPFFKVGYSVGRAIGGDTDAFKKLDIADLNPARNVADLGRHIYAATKKFDRGIWIGKRGLGKFMSVTLFGSGADVSHYGIMIDGTIYHVQPSSGGKTMSIETTSRSSVIESFTWYPTSYYNRKSSWELESYSKHYEESFSYNVLSLKYYQSNCQFFVRDLLAYSTGISEKDAVKDLKIIMGTILF